MVDLEITRKKLIEMLKGTGWDDLLRGFLISEEFMKILKELYALRESGKRFTPPLKQVFTAFMKTPLDKTRVILVGQDPYPQLGVADGMAFSSSNTGKLQASLGYMFEDIYNVSSVPKDADVDLSRWADQGVLLLNTALTCQVDKIGTHYNIWNPFIMYLLDMLGNKKKDTLYLLLGGKAKELIPYIEGEVMVASHPGSALYSDGKWDSGGVWGKINDILAARGEKEIIW